MDPKTGASPDQKGGDVHDRIEPVPRPGFPHHEYPRWIGHKFSPAGETLFFPGNTVLAHLPLSSPFRIRLQDLSATLQKHPLAWAFAFLPQSSWHMTLYEGVTDQIRLRNSYPGDLPLDSSLKVCHGHIATQLADFKHKLGPDGVGQMRVVGFEPIEDGLGLTLEPNSATQEALMRDLRNRLSEKFKMRHSGHSRYSWHMAMAYTLRRLTAEELAEIAGVLEAWLDQSDSLSFELGVPEFCVYDDMCQFRRVYYLG